MEQLTHAKELYWARQFQSKEMGPKSKMLKKSKDEEIDPKNAMEEVAVEAVNPLEEAAGAEAEAEVPVQEEVGAEG